ncbi:MAG: AAA family ATPase [Chitinophagales bacterium]
MEIVKASEIYNTVTEEEIEKAVEYVEQNGHKLKTATTYQFRSKNGSLYPPKDILRYVAKLRNQKIDEDSLSGGEANKPYERLGYSIISKEKDGRYKLKEEFLAVWTINRVRGMTLEEYTNLNKQNSFCYWLESRTHDLGSIWGGSSYKFGIFKRNNIEVKVDDSNHLISDGEYGWYSKYGKNKEQAFNSVKENILKIIECVQSDKLEDIDAIDLGNSYKWKIAFLFGNFNTICIYKYEALQFLGNLDNEKKQHTSVYQRRIINEIDKNADYFKQADILWKKFEQSKNPLISKQKQDFILWLIDNQLNISIAHDIEDLSDDLLSNEQTSFSIYELKTYYEVMQLSFKELIKENWDNLFSFYVDFIVYQIYTETGVDLNYKYALVSCTSQEEYDYFINNNVWDANHKHQVYQEYMNRFDRGDKLALYQLINGKGLKITALGVVIEKPKNKLSFNVNWDNSFESYFVNIQSDIGILDFYELEAWKSQYKFNDIKEVFRKLKLKSMESYPLNQILFGPPGTGKTFKTKELAVNIILGKEQRKRSEILELYKILDKNKKIFFTTFHQSMGYEDFVEGIKPIMNSEFEDGDKTILNYEICDGIFKQVCSKARGVSGVKKVVTDLPDFTTARYHKISLGGKSRPEVHEWCIKENLIALGWGDFEDYKDYTQISDWYEFRNKFQSEYSYLYESSKFNAQAMFRFLNMKRGDIVVASIGNHIIDAIGVVVGEYKFDEKNKFGFYHTREVKWIATYMNASPELFIDKNISQQSIYEFYKQDIKVEAFKDYFSNEGDKLPFDTAFDLLKAKVQEGYLEEPIPDEYAKGLYISMPNTHFSITKIDGDSIKLMISTGKERNTLTKPTLRKIYEDFSQLEVEITGGMKGYYKALVETMYSWSKELSRPLETNNYVLIIDEINRGNVSAIFGELITLLEADKREGQKEEIKVILPYSKEKFSVPSNLHIIGTMNTADRSVEALDTALRRRFSFKEYLPDLAVISNNHSSKGVIEENIVLAKLLERINERIELILDKNHTIGHSYFLEVNNLNDLREVFKDKVIPLLEEYFFGDYGKIGLILGEKFITNINKEKKDIFAQFEGYEDKEFLKDTPVYKFTNENKWDKESFISIYTKQGE